MFDYPSTYSSFPILSYLYYLPQNSFFLVFIAHTNTVPYQSYLLSLFFHCRKYCTRITRTAIYWYFFFMTLHYAVMRYTHICAIDLNMSMSGFFKSSRLILHPPSDLIILFFNCKCNQQPRLYFFLLLQFLIFVLLFLPTEVPYVRAMHAATDPHYNYLSWRKRKLLRTQYALLLPYYPYHTTIFI